MDKKAGWKNRRLIIRVLRILMQVCFWGCIAAESILILGSILLFLWPEAVIKIPGFLGVFGSVNIYINDAFIVSFGKVNPLFTEYAQSEKMLQEILTMGTWDKLIFVYRAIPNFAMALFFFQLNRVMMSVEKGKAFAQENARRLVVMGVVPIGLFIITRAITMIHLLAFNVDMFGIPQTYDLGGLFLGLILLILSRVFKHGHYLQEEYDATV